MKFHSDLKLIRKEDQGQEADLRHLCPHQLDGWVRSRQDAIPIREVVV